METRFIVSWILFGLLAVGCAGTVEVTGSNHTSNSATGTVAAPTRPPQAPEPTALPPDTAAGTDDVAGSEGGSEREPEEPGDTADCRDGWVPLLAGTSSSRFSALDADSFPAARVAVCESDDRELELTFREIDSSDVLRVAACQKSPDVWGATTDDVVFELVDERNSERSTSGVLNEFGADDFVTMMLETDIVRTVERQNRLGTPLCPGSQRLCTSNVGTNEVLNLREGPALELGVLAEIPGGTCALWQNARQSEAGEPGVGWVSVVATLPGSTARVSGWVSSDFVDPATPELVLDAYGVATVPFGTRWTEALPALEHQLGAPDEIETYDTCGNPGETQHRAQWGNLVVLAHAPVDVSATNPPVLTWASVGSGRFTTIGGLGSGSLWSEVVAVLPNSVPVETEWSIIGQSHEYELDGDAETDIRSRWAAENYFEFGFANAIDLNRTDQVGANSVVANISAGHTWKDC